MAFFAGKIDWAYFLRYVWIFDKLVNSLKKGNLVMKKFFAVLMLAAALILPGLAQAKDAQTSMIDDVVKRGVLRVGFSSFVPCSRIFFIT